MAAENVDVITLQEVCSGQHSAIRKTLRSKWSDTFKRTTWKPFQRFGGPIDCDVSNHRLVWALIRWT